MLKTAAANASKRKRMNNNKKDSKGKNSETIFFKSYTCILFLSVFFFLSVYIFLANYCLFVCVCVCVSCFNHLLVCNCTIRLVSSMFFSLNVRGIRDQIKRRSIFSFLKEHILNQVIKTSGKKNGVASYFSRMAQSIARVSVF